MAPPIAGLTEARILQRRMMRSSATGPAGVIRLPCPVTAASPCGPAAISAGCASDVVRLPGTDRDAATRIEAKAGNDAGTTGED